MTVPYAFGAATSAIPLSQLDSNFNTPITLGNTAIQLGNTVTTLNNMTLANVTISSGNVTITNVTVTTANATTVNTTTLIATTANVTMGNVTNLISGNVTLTGGSITGTPISGSTGSFTTLTTSGTVTLNGGVANGVAYLDGSKVLTSGSGLVFDGSNLGLGVTPSAWGSAYKAIDANTRGLSFAGGTESGAIAVNAYWNSGWKYAGTSTYKVSQYQQFDGVHSWFTAPSGNAGDPISFTQAMTLDASGNLGIGTSSPSVRLQVYNNINGTPVAWGNATRTGYLYQDANGVGITNASGTTFDEGIYLDTANSRVSLYTNSTDRVILDSSGNLGLGVTPSTVNTLSSYKSFEVGQAGNAIYAGNNQVILGSNTKWDGGTAKYAQAYPATIYDQAAGAHKWYTAPSGTAGNAISFTQAMTLDASGNLLLGTTTTAYATSGRGLFEVNGSSTSLMALKTGDTARGYFAASSTFTEVAAAGASQPLLFTTNGSERARITSGGYFKASNTGTYLDSAGSFHELASDDVDNAVAVLKLTNASYTGPGAFVDISRNTTNNTFYAISYFNRGASAYKFRVADSGDVTNTNGTYGTISDAKMKTDIVDASSQWADIKAVRFRKFKMKDDPSGLLQLGVVAQEIEQTSPGLVEEHTDRDQEGNDLGTTTKSVKTSVLLMKAAVALQEAMARIEKLEAEVATLKGA